MKRSKVIRCAVLVLVGLFMASAYAYTQMDAQFKYTQATMAKGESELAQGNCNNEEGLAVSNKNIAMDEKADVPPEKQSGGYWDLGNTYLDVGDDYKAEGYDFEDDAYGLYLGGMNYYGAGNAYYWAWDWDNAWYSFDSSINYFLASTDPYDDAGAKYYAAKTAYANAYDAFEQISDD